MSLRLVLMQAARAWGILPSELGLCGVDEDLTYMAALQIVEGQMRAWEQQVVEAEMQNQSQRIR